MCTGIEVMGFDWESISLRVVLNLAHGFVLWQIWMCMNGSSWKELESSVQTLFRGPETKSGASLQSRFTDLRLRMVHAFKEASRFTCFTLLAITIMRMEVEYSQSGLIPYALIPRFITNFSAYIIIHALSLASTERSLDVFTFCCFILQGYRTIALVDYFLVDAADLTVRVIVSVFYMDFKKVLWYNVLLTGLRIWHNNQTWSVSVDTIRFSTGEFFILVLILTLAGMTQRFALDYFGALLEAENAQQQLALEKGATESLLPMLCDSVFWLAAKNETVLRSDPRLDSMIGVNMLGVSLTEQMPACERPRLQQMLEEDECRPVSSPSRPVKLLSTSLLRNGMPMQADMFIVDRRGEFANSAAPENESLGFLIGLRISQNDSEPREVPVDQKLPKASLLDKVFVHKKKEVATKQSEGDVQSTAIQSVEENASFGSSLSETAGLSSDADGSLHLRKSQQNRPTAWRSVSIQATPDEVAVGPTNHEVSTQTSSSETSAQSTAGAAARTTSAADDDDDDDDVPVKRLESRSVGLQTCPEPQGRKAECPSSTGTFEPVQQHDSCLISAFVSTHARSRALSLLWLVRHWNMPRDPNACCPLHTVLCHAVRTAKLLMTSNCDALWSPHVGWQCASCAGLNPASRLCCELCFAGRAEQSHPDLGAKWDTGYLSESSDPPHEWNVIIEKSSQLLLGITVQKSERCLVIASVSVEGLVNAWNTANPSRSIRPGDSIIRVNDSCEDCDELVRALQESDKLFIGVLRDGSSGDSESAATSPTPLTQAGSAGSVPQSLANSDLQNEEGLERFLSSSDVEAI